jgi:hypothetical protein
VGREQSRRHVHALRRRRRPVAAAVRRGPAGRHDSAGFGQRHGIADRNRLQRVGRLPSGDGKKTRAIHLRVGRWNDLGLVAGGRFTQRSTCGDSQRQLQGCRDCRQRLLLKHFRLYAADFVGKKIDVYDEAFHPVTLAAGAFKDSKIPAEFGPFNITNIEGKLFVAYAQVDAEGDEVAGKGLGYVDVYDADGNLLQRFAARES